MGDVSRVQRIKQRFDFFPVACFHSVADIGHQAFGDAESFVFASIFDGLCHADPSFGQHTRLACLHNGAQS